MGQRSVEVVLRVCGADGRKQTLADNTLHWSVSFEVVEVIKVSRLRSLWDGKVLLFSKQCNTFVSTIVTN